nr:LamG domain-containing protein [Rhizomicrobium palustre]
MISATPNLVAYWRLSEGAVADVVAKDSGPNKKDGEYKNPVGVTRSVLGALSLGPDAGDLAAEFDGTQGYVEIPFDPLINPQVYFSLELWVRPPDNPIARHVIAGAYELDGTGKLLHGYVLDHIPGTPPKFRIRLGTNNVAAPVALAFDYGDGLDFDKWRHIVVVYDGSISTLSAYVNCKDGKPVATIASMPGKPVVLQGNQTSLTRLGVGFDEKPHPAPVLGFFYKGRIDEVALYNGALSGATVQAHFKKATAL